MALSVFDDKSMPPTEAEVRKALGNTYSLWKQIRDTVTERYSPIVVEWGYSGKAYGWGLRLKEAKRALLYLTPCDGYFLASFALGEKAVQAAKAAKLPAGILKTIDEAPKYAEGRGVRIEVRNSADAKSILILAAIKAAS
jgi:hypothetical protein